MLVGLACGATTKTIAGFLGVSDKTVEYHRARLFQRTHTHNLAGLTRFAIRHGFVKP